MTKATEDLEPEQVFFRGPTTIILSATNIEHVVSLQISEINNKIEEFVRNGKAWLYILSFKIWLGFLLQVLAGGLNGCLTYT